MSVRAPSNKRCRHAARRAAPPGNAQERTGDGGRHRACAGSGSNASSPEPTAVMHTAMATYIERVMVPGLPKNSKLRNDRLMLEEAGMDDSDELPEAVTYLLLFILGLGFLGMIITAVPILDWI